MAALPAPLPIILVVSSWANISLYTLEIVLCVRYFMRPSRPLAHRIAVSVMLFADNRMYDLNKHGMCASRF
ncbi:hypothetical protein B0H14DRAFT_3519042 [Mycena olivaceomarginata]|nr:hypothetical protein B0H14DRAFT_3519042 [Mycena olivaceomarginata]